VPLLIPTLGQSSTAAPFDWRAALFNLVAAHPTAAVVVIVFLSIAAAVGIVVWAAWKAGVGETIARVITHKADEKVTTDRDEARERQRQAEQLAQDVIGEAELLRLALKTAASCVQRLNDMPAQGPERDDAVESAKVYVCDWATRIFAFSKKDINKVTTWCPTARGTLKVATYNGMAPESAKELEFDIHPPTPDRDTFAAMAYRAGEAQVCHDVDTDARYRQLGRPPSHPYKSIIAVPLRKKGQVIGSMTIDSLFVGNFDTDQQRQLAELAASLFAMFLEPAGGEPLGESPALDG
jgi:GAF domain-containing protein